MRNKKTFLLLATLVVIATTWWFWPGNKTKQLAVQVVAELIGGKTGAMLGMAASTVVPVHFYGRVIDQHGQGVAGARVDMVIGGGGSMAPGTGRTYFETDAEGYFEVKAKGQGVSIGTIRHPDLADVYYPNRHDGRKVPGLTLEATNMYGEKNNWNSYDKKDNPLIINVWWVEKFEKVKAGYGGLQPIPNAPPSKESTRFGIITTCLREPKDTDVHSQQQKGSWSIALRPIDGGIQETTDLYLNEAPESGYQSELTVSMERGSLDYRVRIWPAKHYYYYYMDDGKRIYGSLEAEFDPYAYDDECRVRVQYKYNLNGARNLAVRSKR